MAKGKETGGFAGKELLIRIAAAAVLAPVALAAVWAGDWIFALLCAAGAVIVVLEWWKMCGYGASTVEAVVIALAFAATAWLVLTFELQGAVALFAVMIAAGALSGLLRKGGSGWRAAGVAYAGLAMLALLVIRNDYGFGLVGVVWILALVWATDIAAYGAGRLIGGPKIWPRVSPKKTWAGLIGGVAAAAATGYVIASQLAESPAGLIALMSAGLAVVAQAGDFMESALKRRFGQKDSGTLIPGHGGLMDRVDGMLAVAVVAALIGIWREGPDLAARGLLIW